MRPLHSTDFLLDNKYTSEIDISVRIKKEG